MDTRRHLSKRLILPLLLIAVLLLSVPAFSQDDAPSGVIVVGNTRGVAGLGSLNPLRCSNAECRQITDLLFPWLLGIDHERGVFTTGTAENNGLTTEWEISDDGRVYTLHLREDAVWSDGTPITANDVFFSYAAAVNTASSSTFRPQMNGIIGAVPLDTYTIAFVMEVADCGALHSLQFPVVPASATLSNFTDEMATFFNPDESLIEQAINWREANRDRRFFYTFTSEFDTFPDPTSGSFRLDAVQVTDYVRLTTPDGRLSFNFVDTPGLYDEIVQFLNGDLDILFYPPYDRWNDIIATPDVRVYESVGTSWDYISFNLADPTNPQSVVDDEGNPLEQGHHPIFGDIRVRQAIALALDIDGLIDNALYGHGTRIYGDQPPTSWAFNPDIAPIEHNVTEAVRLLDEAGWRRVPGQSGVRACLGCLYAREGRPLIFTLMYSQSGGSYRDTVAALIQQQLNAIGFQVDIIGMDFDSIRSQADDQRYDAFLSGWTEAYPINPDNTLLFSSRADVVGTGFNFGSYHNPRVDELLDRARTLSGCDFDERATIYREIQTILREDIPYLFLYSRHDMVAVRGSISGFDPFPIAPLWNIAEWTVFR